MVHLFSPSIAWGCAFSHSGMCCRSHSGPWVNLCMLVTPHSALTWHPEEQNVPVMGLSTPHNISTSCICRVPRAQLSAAPREPCNHAKDTAASAAHQHRLFSTCGSKASPASTAPALLPSLSPHAWCMLLCLLARPLPSWRCRCSPSSASWGQCCCWAAGVWEPVMAGTKKDMEPASFILCYGTLHDGLWVQSFCMSLANFTAHLPPRTCIPVKSHFIWKEGNCAMPLTHLWLRSDFLSPQCDVRAALRTFYET